MPDTTLLLVGPGDPAPLESAAPHQWGRTIRWCGAHSDVRPWLWASDLLVLPSLYETVAVVVGEAMACGRPVVATQVNGVSMAISDGPYSAAGAVVSPGNMNDLIKECQRRLEDRHLWERESTAGRERALTLFNTAAVVDRLDAAYGRAIQRQVPAEGVKRRRVDGKTDRPQLPCRWRRPFRHDGSRRGSTDPSTGLPHVAEGTALLCLAWDAT